MMNKSVMKCCICNNNNVGEYDVINNKKYHICCIEDLKRRVDKAIEYINTWVYDEYSIAIQDPENDYLCSTDEHAIENLLEILGGKE